jgi:hypothetical protein
MSSQARKSAFVKMLVQLEPFDGEAVRLEYSSKEEERLSDAKAVTIGRALMAKMEEKASIISMVREILDRRLTFNRERVLFDLKLLDDDKDAANKSESEPPKMTLVKDAAA